MDAKEYSVDDLNRYLRRGMAFATTDGLLHPIYIEKVFNFFDEETDKAILSAKVYKPSYVKGVPTGSWASDRLDTIPFDIIDLSPLPIGCFNYKEGACFLKRAAERQWNMAINGSAYKVASCNSNNAKSVRGLSIESPSILLSIKNNKFYDIDTAVSEIRAGNRYSAALSSNFWVGVDKYTDNLLIGHKSNNIIGWVKPDNSVILFKGFEFLIESLAQVTPVGGIEDAA